MAFESGQVKSILASKTFWGALISMIAILFPHMFGTLLYSMNISDADLLVDKIVGAFGTGFAIYGRLAARKIATITGN
jgi:hypothetical protein